MDKITSSPWGKVDEQRVLAPGIVQVFTPSHGGIYVAPDLLAKMPIKSTAYSQGGWFEEDCDWSLVALAFPEAFDAKSLAVAKSIAARYFPNLEVTI